MTRARQKTPVRLKTTAILLTIIAIASTQPTLAHGQKPMRPTRTIQFEPNVHSPELYADDLTMQFMLVNLPGAGNQGTSWSGEYQLYFIPEAEFEKNRKSDPRAKDFANTILLAEGTFKESGLATPQSRTVLRRSIAYKSRIPDGQRTKFAKLLTVYSVKIHDAKLNTTLYKSGIWIGHTFDSDERFSESGKTLPRRIVYANFFVAPDGGLAISQWRHEANNPNW